MLEFPHARALESSADIYGSDCFVRCGHLHVAAPSVLKARPPGFRMRSATLPPQDIVYASSQFGVPREVGDHQRPSEKNNKAA